MQKPTKEQAENAIKILLEYLGEDINREGLRDTPKRVIKSYNDLFSGYNTDVEEVLNKKFYEISQYSNIILLKNVNFTSTCEHHMLPFIGTVDIAYIPDKVVIGISKLARLVDAFAKRLQIQERMTVSIAENLHKHLQPKGVAIKVSATHSCMSFRGVMKEGSFLDTSHFTGCFKDDLQMQNKFFEMIK